MSAYGNRVYVVEVESDLTPGHWTDMSEHSALEYAVKQAATLQVASRWRKAIPADRIRIREFEISGVFGADGRLHVEKRVS